MPKIVMRILAWTGIFVLVGLYVMALVAAISKNPASSKVFISAIYSTFIIPVFIYVMKLVYNFTHRNDAVDKSDVNKMLRESADKELDSSENRK